MRVPTLRVFPRSGLVFAGIGLICFSGCSVVMATKQPGYKDLSVLDSGHRRADVVAELGTPLLTEEKDGKKVDIFAFTQGYSKGNKVGRAVFHGVADVFSFGLWEVVGTPTEAIANGKEMKVEVTYDQDDKVEKVNYLQSKK